MKQMTDEWYEWTQTNLKRGCRREEIQQRLRQNGFSDQHILLAMMCQSRQQWKSMMAQQAVSPKSDVVTGVQPNVDYKKVAKPALLQNPDVRKVEVDGLQLFVLENFMTGAECERIIEVINNNLRPSTLTSGKDYSGFRTSSTCDLARQQDDTDFVTQIDARISKTLGISHEWSEAIQAQKYEVGQEFKAHTDYFEPGTNEFAKHAQDRGQRTWTFMVYLNETPSGGATYFTEVDKIFYPKTGCAVIWNSLNKDGSPNYLSKHHGMPVKEGQKIIITKWFRDKGTGNMML